MNIVTRHSVFETNSSSTHSISLNPGNTKLFTSISPDDNGRIVLNGGEFGWEWQKYNDALTKANYCAVDCAFDKDKESMLIDVIKEHTGAKTIVFNFTKHTSDGKNASYIDHQSDGTSNDAFKSKEILKSFIFDPDSILFTGNDNESIPPNFYDKNVDSMGYYIKLEGTDSVHYIHKKDIKNKEKIKDIISGLFSKNQYSSYNHNNFNRNEGYDMKYDTDNGIDFDKNIVHLIKEKYYYNKGEYSHKTIEGEKFISFEILKRS